MKKVLLAAPSYGALDPEIQKNLRVAMMSAALHDIQWAGDVSSIREGWVSGRNRAAKAALKDAGPDITGVCWVDDDVLLPPEAFTRLIGYDRDFVTGILHQKVAPYWPLVAHWNGRGFAWWHEYPLNVIAPADGCGFGICYTSTNLLRKIAELPDIEEDGWFNQFAPWAFKSKSECKPGEPWMSEDFSFCMRAKQAGVQLWADTGLLCKHMIGPDYATEEKFRTEMAKRRLNGTADGVRAHEGQEAVLREQGAMEEAGYFGPVS